MNVLAQLRSFVLPISVAGLVPALLLQGTAREDPSLVQRGLGGLLLAGGLGMLVWTIMLFIRLGKGTLAPWDPPTRLVLKGPYVHVRNPMISGVLCILAGEAIFFSSPAIGYWAAAVLAMNHVYFLASEEPGLLERFGEDYERYKANVPRWIPRLTPWHPPTDATRSPE